MPPNFRLGVQPLHHSPIIFLYFQKRGVWESNPSDNFRDREVALPCARRPKFIKQKSPIHPVKANRGSNPAYPLEIILRLCRPLEFNPPVPPRSLNCERTRPRFTDKRLARIFCIILMRLNQSGGHWILQMGLLTLFLYK